MKLRPLTTDEAPAAAHTAAVSMGGDADDETIERWRSNIAEGVAWGLEDDGQLVGQCKLLPTDHWFGGQPVRCLDVAAVSVPPQHRGRGVARAMMDAVVARGRAEGYGLSILFPATTALYRKLGWELAGTRSRFRVATRMVPPSGPTLRAADRDTDWAAIQDCHRRAVSAMSGPAQRRPEHWAALAEVPHRYVLDTDGRPTTVEAYALVQQHDLADDWQHGLRIADWQSTTARGFAAVVGLVGRWNTMARRAEFVDTFPSRWTLPEQDLDVKHLHWMARGLDLHAAVAARGFPDGLALAVTLRIEDAGDMRGPWRLEVADGRGQLVPAGGADVRMDGRAFGPLFTGFRSAHELAALGLLNGPRESLGMLGAAFAGPPPVLFDFF